MGDLLELVVDLGAVALVLFVLAAVIAPFETLGWWAGWSRRLPRPISLSEGLTAAFEAPGGHSHAAYIVYLNGLGATDVQGLTPSERGFLQRLAERLPDAAIVDDVFPYSAINVPLTGARPMRWLWSWIARVTRRSQSLIWLLVAVRNLLQVAVSADHRYGPVYSFGVARAILLRLLRRGYRRGSAAPIILLGFSGGGQVAVGAAARLHLLLEAPVYVISVGGVITSDPAILQVEHLYHLASPRDPFPALGLLLYPGRWPALRRSAWNRALREGRRTVIPVPPMTHMGPDDYLSAEATLPDGRSHVAHTVGTVADIVDQIRYAQRPA